MLGEPEEARPLVAGLRARGDGPDLDVREAEREQPGRDHLALVEPCRQAERVREGEPERLHRCAQALLVGPDLDCL